MMLAKQVKTNTFITLMFYGNATGKCSMPSLVIIKGKHLYNAEVAPQNTKLTYLERKG